MKLKKLMSFDGTISHLTEADQFVVRLIKLPGWVFALMLKSAFFAYSNSPQTPSQHILCASSTTPIWPYHHYSVFTTHTKYTKLKALEGTVITLLLWCVYDNV